MSTKTSSQANFESMLRDCTRAGVFHLPCNPDQPLAGREKLIAAAEACGFVVFQVDLAHVTDKEDLLEAIGNDMAFPEWFGANWDALADCLKDLGWRPAEGYLVLFEHCAPMIACAEGDLEEALKIFEDAAKAWREQGVALWCLVDAQVDGLARLPSL